MQPPADSVGGIALQIICILNRFLIKIIDKSRIAAKGICMDHRHILMVGIDRFRKSHIKITTLFLHKFTSRIIVSLKIVFHYGMIYKMR